MIKEALEYVIGLKKPEIITVGEHTYSDKQLNLIKEPIPTKLVVTTLQGIVDYIRQNPDDIKVDRNLILHIAEPDVVYLYNKFFTDGQRPTYVKAEALLPTTYLNTFIDIERFIINLQAGFVQNAATAEILKVVGNITENNTKQTLDDGVTQTVIAKVGIARKDEVALPNPVVLAPYRTFVEVEQPESKFIFRMQEGPKCGLFEADGGVWKIEAMARIKAFFAERLADTNITIIS